VIIGTKELEEKTCLVKNLATKEQVPVALDGLADFSFL
jgi:histidyl-tRNA synthetase